MSSLEARDARGARARGGARGARPAADQGFTLPELLLSVLTCAVLIGCYIAALEQADALAASLKPSPHVLLEREITIAVRMRRHTGDGAAASVNRQGAPSIHNAVAAQAEAAASMPSRAQPSPPPDFANVCWPEGFGGLRGEEPRR